ncbi:MAG: hypothetical protein PUH37_01030 [Parafannyhessea umbonata]|nr:hypothetical protein [Parafannyhessea umbonata]
MKYTKLYQHLAPARGPALAGFWSARERRGGDVAPGCLFFSRARAVARARRAQ